MGLHWPSFLSGSLFFWKARVITLSVVLSTAWLTARCWEEKGGGLTHKEVSLTFFQYGTRKAQEDGLSCSERMKCYPNSNLKVNQTGIDQGAEQNLQPEGFHKISRELFLNLFSKTFPFFF